MKKSENLWNTENSGVNLGKIWNVVILTKAFPEPTPVKTKLPPEIFNDALMTLEFLNAFGELFDLQDECPEVLEEDLVGSGSEG